MPELPSLDDGLTAWSVPRIEQDDLELLARPGEVTTIVGANGSGKSALGQWLDRYSTVDETHRIIAHRRLWFQHPGPGVSSGRRAQLAESMFHWSQDESSRYVDHVDDERPDVILFDFLARVNAFNRDAVAIYRSGGEPEGVDPLARLNLVLKRGDLPVQLELSDRQTLMAANTDGERYPASEMSDGEKSAVLLAAQVLAAPENSVLILDEPERHLHRAISRRVIEAIVESRADCHFVVLTHDLNLGALLTQLPGQTYSLMTVAWNEGKPEAWDLRSVDPVGAISDQARRAILGGRDQVIFVEGDRGSLDLSLYEILFPKWTFAPLGGAGEVIRAVTGLLESEQHHWVRARGIVDGDGRTRDERAKLAARGVRSLPVSEVENLYYVDFMIEAVARRQAHAIDRDVDDLLDAAIEGALQAFAGVDNQRRLARDVALGRARRQLMGQLPTALADEAMHVELAIESPFPELLAEITDLQSDSDLDGLVRLLPIRDTALPGAVASALEYKKIDHYRSAARACLRESDALAHRLRDIIGLVP